VSREDIVDCIVRTEYSEWNDLFLYLIDTCKSHDVRFERMAAEMQSHQARIAEFLRTAPESTKFGTALDDSRRVWTWRYLVVDDNPATRKLYRRMLEGDAEVITAADGNAALEQLSNLFFDAVVSDVDMPGMDGLTFFRTHRERHPYNAGTFVFCTGNVTNELRSLCEEYGFTYFEKPFSLAALRDTLRRARIAHQTPHGSENSADK
jgi:CheY-like chemotaxis protein